MGRAFFNGILSFFSHYCGGYGFLCFFRIACSIVLAGVEVGEIVAVAGGAVAAGEAVGDCANELNASAREQT